MATIRCSLVLLAASFIAMPVVGQDTQSFYPLGDGDFWVYRYTDTGCNTNEPPPNCDQRDTAFVGREVTGDVTVEGEVRARVRVEVYNQPGQEPTCVADYGVWFDAAMRRVQVVPVEGACSIAFGDTELLPLVNEPPTAGVVQIGGVQYEVMTLDAYVEEAFSDHFYTFASAIGFVGGSESYHLTGSSFTEITAYSLQYAEVDGEVYGTMPVANEDEVVPYAFALGAAYPNPFRLVTTLSLSIPAPEAVTVEVFDVLGRHVLERDLGVQPSGTQPVTLDLSAVPPGVYFARATTASGQQATRRIVRIE